jgi:nucleotide-binding universal stress UspA family protein
MQTRDPQGRAPILAAFSTEGAAREPVEFGLAASRVTGAPLVVVNVRQAAPIGRAAGVAVDDSVGDADRTLEHLRIDMRRRKIDLDVRVVEARTVVGGLTGAMERLEPELVVLGSSGRGAAGSVLLGTLTERVIHEAACPVAIVPEGYRAPENGVEVVGAAFAPTREGREALDVAAALARAAGVRLRVITACDSKHAEEAEATVREALAELGADPGTDVDVLVGDPAEGLVAASRGVGMLVMGSRGRGPRRAVLLGSVSRKVASGAHCPVLVLARGATAMGQRLVSDAATHLTR